MPNVADAAAKITGWGGASFLLFGDYFRKGCLGKNFGHGDAMTIEEARALIACPKVISEKPSGYRLEGAYRRRDFSCTSLDAKDNFKVFIRVSEAFVENFSVGLVYISKDGSGSPTLMRCNGRHGPSAIWPHHDKFHIHRVDEASLENGILAERSIIETDSYSNVEEAVWFFVNEVNIQEPQKYFSRPQPLLF